MKNSDWKGLPVSTDRPTLVDPPIEPLLVAAGDSKFTLVAAASKRAREINDYWNGLGKGSGRIVPPQVVSRSNKSLTMALEEMAEDKLAIRRPTAEELEEERAEQERLAAELATDEFGLLSDVRPSDSFNEPETL